MVVGGVAAAVLSAAMLETLLPLLPMETGWAATLRLVMIASDGGRVVPVNLAIEREEQIQVPSGRFDCWVVVLSTDRPLKTVWVSRDGRGVVRTEERLPEVGGAVLEQSLAVEPSQDRSARRHGDRGAAHRPRSPLVPVS